MSTRRQHDQLAVDLKLLAERIRHVVGVPRAMGSGARRAPWVELLRVLNGTGEFEEIPWRIPNTVGLTARIARHMQDSSNHAIARAVYENTYYNTGVESFIARGELLRGNWNFFTRLAQSLNLPLTHGLDLLNEPPVWMIDVDEAHHEVRVWLRELALQDMLLAAMEAYLVPAGSGKPSTEIYGIVFGSMRMGPPAADRAGISLVEYNVERVCIQHRANCGPSEVFADERSEATQLAMGEELFPYWHLLGDFHTHPFRTLGELRQRRGWRYSTADEQMNVEWCQKLRAMGHRPRVALILAITRAGRRNIASVEGWNGMPHVLKTTIGRCHCFISAYRIRRDGRYTTDGIALKCPHLAGYTAPSKPRGRVLALPGALELPRPATQHRRYARP